jgi:fluoroacetyl-CoA thioesterase
MPSVLATGYLVGLTEWTCMQALAGHLDEGERTVGIHVDLSHEGATPPGCDISIDVELIEVDRRVLVFSVQAKDDAAVVSRGTHRRAVIDLRRFEDRLAGRGMAAPEG